MNQTATYDIYAIAPMTLGCGLTQSGSTVTVNLSTSGYQDVFPAIQPGDALLLTVATVDAYDGRWIIDTVDVPSMTLTFTHTSTGLAPAVASIQIAVAVVSTYQQPAFAPGVGVVIAGNTANGVASVFNGAVTVRYVLPGSGSGVTFTTEFAVDFPLGTIVEPLGLGGTITGVINVGTNPPVITSFAASPSSIATGATSTLTWTTTNADTCLLAAGMGSSTIVSPNGSLAVTPGATTVYTLTAINSSSQVSKTVTVTVTDGVAATLTATPQTLAPGSASTLNWTTTNAVSATISPTLGSVALSGSSSVTPAATTTYTITATGSTGATATASVTIVVSGTKGGGPVSTSVPVVHFMACTWDANAAAYIGDLLGQYPPVNMLAATRTGYSLAALDLNGASGTTFSSNGAANFVAKDDAGNLYFGLQEYNENDFHLTKTTITPPGLLAPLDRSNWTATATHDNGAGYTPDKALDSNRGSYWWSGQNKPQTLTIDMGAAYFVNFLGIDPGTAHPSNFPTSVTITVDGVLLGTFSLSSNPVESLVPVQKMGQVWALDFTATVGGGWVEVAEVHGYVGSGSPYPTFTRVASGDLIGVGSPSGVGHFGCYMPFDKTVIYNHGNVLYKSSSADLSLIGSASLTSTGAAFTLMGTVSTGQLWVASLNEMRLVAAAQTNITITSVAVSGGNAVYSYSGVTGPVLMLGMLATVSGFPTSGNNVTGKKITALGSGTFTVTATTQANETAAASGIVPLASTIASVTLTSFAISGSLDAAFLDTYNSGKAWLNVFGASQSQVYHVDLSAVTVVAGPGALPVHDHHWNIAADPAQSTRLYGIHTSSSDASLYLVDTATLAVTSVPLAIGDFQGNLIPDPSSTPSGIGYQKNTAITFVQGKQATSATAATFTSGVTAGNLVVVTLSHPGAVDGRTITLGTNTFTAAYASTGRPFNIAVYFAVANNSGDTAVTVSGTAVELVQIAEITGAHAVNDVTPSAAFGNNPSLEKTTLTASLTTVTDWDLLLAVFATDYSNGDSTTPRPFLFPLASGYGGMGWLSGGKAQPYSISLVMGTNPGVSVNHALVLLALTPNSPVITDVGGSVYFPTYVLNNLTNAGRNPDFLIDDEFQIVVAAAPPNAQVDINVNGTWTLAFGTTDGSGAFTYASTFSARPHPGNYYQINVQNFSAIRVNGFLTNALTYTVSDTGTPIPLSGIVFTMTNVTDVSRFPTFVFTDTFRLSLTGAPINSSVDINVNGGWTTGFGTTDGSGNFAYQAAFNDGIVDVLYLSQNPYNFVYFRVNGLLSTVVVFRVQFSMDGLVWIQHATDISFAGLWYGVDPLNGRTVETMGVESGLFGGYNGSLGANVALIYNIPGAFQLVAPEGLIGPAVVEFTTGPSSSTSSGGIVPVAGGDDTQAMILLPAFNAGDRRAQKMFGDLFAEAAVATGTAMIVSLWQSQYKNPVAVYSPAVLTPLNGGLRSPYIINLSSEGLYTTDIEAIIAWPVGPKTSLVTWQPSVIAQPESVESRPSDWDSAGTPGNKFVQGLMLEFDSFGVGKTFGVQRSDDGGVYVPVECPATSLGQRTQSFTFVPPFLAHDMRIVSGDKVPWRTYSVKWIFQPYPEQSVNWQTEMVSFGTGWQSMLFINLPHISTSDITLTLTFDQGPVSSITVAVPNSGGKFIKSKVTLGFNKFKLASFRVFSVEKCTVFEKDVEVWVKQWGSDGPFSPVRPFGGPSSPGAEV